MHHDPHISRRAFGLGLAGTLLVASTASARQGLSPFREGTPVADSPAPQGWRIREAEVLDLDGLPVALSPDGQWLAGVDRDRAFSIWSTSDRQQTVVPFHEPIDIDSIAWSPDSTAIAFGVEAFLRGIDGDIFVYELADGEVRNLTDDGYEGSVLGTDDRATNSFPIDVMPAWTPDSNAIVFARSTREEADSIPTEIARIPRTGGDVEILTSIPDRPFSIYTPMRVLADGSIVYAVGFADVGDAMNGLWKLDPDGTTSQLVPGAASDTFPTPVILDVWASDSELRISGLSARLAAVFDTTRPWLFTWSSNTGELEPVAEGDFTDPISQLSACWSPDGGTLLVIGLQPGGQVTVETTGPASELTALPESDGRSAPGPRWTRPTWSAADTVLIPPISGPAYLLTMEPVDIPA